MILGNGYSVVTMSMIKSITASLRTDTGQVREHNEDFVGLWEPVDESFDKYYKEDSSRERNF